MKAYDDTEIVSRLQRELDTAEEHGKVHAIMTEVELLKNALELIKHQRAKIAVESFGHANAKITIDSLVNEVAVKDATIEFLKNKISDGGNKMNIHDATEISYKNGYEKGIADFAKRLKENIDNGKLYSTVDDYELTITHIKNTAKELMKNDAGEK